MSKESLGVVSCSGCNGNAHIKRRSNGKKLLYLHCKSCGLDQRSGKLLQARWQLAVDGGFSDPSELDDEVKKLNEWQPEELENDNKQTNENDSTTSNSTIKWFAGLAIGLIGIGIGLKS